MEIITKEETKELKMMSKALTKKWEAHEELERAIGIKISPIMKKLEKAGDLAGLYKLVALIPPHSHMGAFVYQSIHKVIESKKKK